MIFEDIDDVRNWLEPLGYRAFWEAIEPYSVFPEGDREHCDGLLEKGTVDPDTILYCLKSVARMSLTKKFGLAPRIYEPIDAQYIRSIH